MQVAGKVRDGKTIAFHPYETGLATPVRNIHRTLAVDIDITGDKKRIGASDQRNGRVIEAVQMLSRACLRIRQRHPLKLTQLNVLRAVAEGLIHAHVKTISAQIADMAVEAIAPQLSIVLTTDSDEKSLFGTAGHAAALSRWRDAGAEEVVVKRGAEGAAAQRGGELVETPVPSAVRVVDSTGAGDSFNAAYLITRLAGGTLREAVHAGHILAGAVVQVSGAILPVMQMPPMPASRGLA
jgi:hypothetical protein